MIERDRNTYLLICDICGGIEIYDTFDEAVEGKKIDGWKSEIEKSQWIDICPDCRKVK